MNHSNTGQRLTRLLADVREFKIKVDALSGKEFWSNHQINREWESLNSRVSTFRASIATLSPKEKTEFYKDYSTSRDELFTLIDELTTTVHKKSDSRKDKDQAAKYGMMALGVLGFVFGLVTGHHTD